MQLISSTLLQNRAHSCGALQVQVTLGIRQAVNHAVTNKNRS